MGVVRVEEEERRDWAPGRWPCLGLGKEKAAREPEEAQRRQKE